MAQPAPSYGQSVRYAAPKTKRGRATRERLVTAGRGVFESRGYLDSRVADIVAAAGMGQGSFYDYFRSKKEIFIEIVHKLEEDLYQSAKPSPDVGHDPVERIRSSNHSYLHAYRENASLIKILEQVATFDPEVQEIRLRIRRRVVARVERGLRRLQRQGLADTTIDPHCAASAVASMIGHFAYTWLALGDHSFEEDVVVETLTRIWVSGFGMTTGTEPFNEDPPNRRNGSTGTRRTTRNLHQEP